MQVMLSRRPLRDCELSVNEGEGEARGEVAEADEREEEEEEEEEGGRRAGLVAKTSEGGRFLAAFAFVRLLHEMRAWVAMRA